jgi:hypothetical protein
MKSLLGKVVIVSVVLLFCIYFLSQSVLEGRISNITYGVLGYFTLFTLLFQFGLWKSSLGKPDQFIRYYMGATALKFMLHLAVILVYCLLINREQAVPFIINFAVFYLVFTVFESVISIRQFGKKS